jgi:hypothetical protein
MILICLFFLRIKFALSVNWEILIPKINNAFVKMYGVIMLWITYVIPDFYLKLYVNVFFLRVISLTAANMISVPYKSNSLHVMQTSSKITYIFYYFAPNVNVVTTCELLIWCKIILWF